jgi:proteasome lid subunit RPN8/RPN11
MIVLQESVLAVMREHASSEYPNECCGALVGRLESDARIVSEAWPLANASAGSRRRRFAVSSADYRRVETRAGAGGFALLGFYHSHPDSAAEPSEYDLLEAWPNFDYIILSIVDARPGRLTGWRLRNDRSAFTREEISWQPES